MKTVRILTILQMTILIVSVLSSSQQLLPQIQQVIQIAKQNIWNQIQPNEPLWNFPPWLGTLFLSQYYFQLKALNISGDVNMSTNFNTQFFKNKLINQQQADGSWKQIVDLNKNEGLLDATIFNYWYLKDVGVDQGSQALRKARKFVLDHGGIENSQVMTRFKLAAFGQYQWHLLPYIPLLIFKKGFPFDYLQSYIKDYIAQWVYPHLLPLAYLRYHKTTFPVSKVCLSQLRTSRSNICQQIIKQYKVKKNNQTKIAADFDVSNLLEQSIKLRGKRGAYGAYTISTLLTLLSFKDYQIRYIKDDYTKFYQETYVQSLNFVQYIYFNRRVPYQGSLDDGRYWDTILAAMALLEAGENPQKLHPTIKYLIDTAVQQNGGIPYGWQFQYAPDIDDTSLLMLLYGKLQKHYLTKGNHQLYKFYGKEIQKTYNWIASNQNSDGGFPAFDKNKNDDQYIVVKMIFKMMNIDRSAQIFDPSCADITAHIFEGMGECGLNKDQNIHIINKGIQYLHNTQKQKLWSARWGINYVYAAGAVIPGLARLGYSLRQTWIEDAIKKLKQVQHEDGGFGQDSQGYNKGQFLDGVSTVSMTAWGLLAFVEVAEIYNVQDNIQRATKYILNNFKQNGNKFFDRSVVGTGHRGVLNLQYPVYAYSFPLIALSRVRKSLSNQWNQYINTKLNIEFKKYNNTQENDL